MKLSISSHVIAFKELVWYIVADGSNPCITPVDDPDLFVWETARASQTHVTGSPGLFRRLKAFVPHSD